MLEIYVTQGGGYAKRVGNAAIFVKDLDIPGQYHFDVGDKVPESWGLAFIGDFFEEDFAAYLKRISTTLPAV